jgi:dihydroneopterin aldolase
VTQDRIVLSGIELRGRHGVLPAERAGGQRFLVDIEIAADLAGAGRTDDLALTVDYREVYAVAREIIEGRPMALIEAVAEAIATRVLAIPRVEAVAVRVRKPDVALGGPLESAAVEVRRTRSA